MESIKNLVEEVSGEKEVSSPKAEDDLEPVKDDASNGQVVPVLKVEDVEVTGVEEGDKEVAKPTMSKIASMKRDLSFGRLQKMFSREAKSEPPQHDAAAKVADEPSPDSELSATDEEQVKAFVDTFISCELPSRDDELNTLVDTLQRHNHTSDIVCRCVALPLHYRCSYCWC